MSRLNYQNDLFLGLQELRRMTKFHKDDGYIRLFKSLINNFGIVKVDTDTSFTNFEVTAGSVANTFKIAVDSYAIDADMNIIFQEAVNDQAVTADSNYYWIKVAYTEDNIEEGTVSVTSDGSLTGVGTTFTDVLRDQNNYPVKMSFPSSASNTSDYQVVSVLSDTQAILSGTFVSENNIDYQVVGSFTPGISPSGSDRLPYFYDSCTISLVAEVSPNIPPAKVDGSEFYIARVRNISSGTLDIVDKRYLELFSAAQTTEGWVQPSLLAGFANVSGREVEYRKNYLGDVQIRGSFTATSGTGDLFSLPDELIPAYTIQGTYGVADQTTFGIITVDDDGIVHAGDSDPFDTGQANVIMNLTFQLT